MSKLYIYLANRNKDGIKILNTSSCSTIYNSTKINDVYKIGLEPSLEEKISNYYNKFKMSWDLIIESADSYKNLKDSLKKRGYYNLPLFSGSLFQEQLDSVVNSIEKSKQKTTIKPNNINIKTMIRKNNK